MTFRDFQKRLQNVVDGVITFKVTRSVDPEFYAIMKIEGATDFQIKYRFVNAPVEELKKTRDIEELLDVIFKYGQNDFQPVEFSPSVSVGDIIHFFDRQYRVLPVSFERAD